MVAFATDGAVGEETVQKEEGSKLPPEGADVKAEEIKLSCDQLGFIGCLLLGVCRFARGQFHIHACHFLITF